MRMLLSLLFLAVLSQIGASKQHAKRKHTAKHTTGARSTGIKPNIIVFMADDLGYNDIGSFGSPTMITPNLDRLAVTGVKMTQYYSVAPLCSASRASLLTGRLPVRTGAYTNYSYPRDLQHRVYLPNSKYPMRQSEITVAELLKEQGYHTGLIGKWHLGHTDQGLPTYRGFDYFYGLPYSHEEGYPGPELESLVFPPVPLMENTDIIEQPVNLSTLQPRYNSITMDWLDNATHGSNPDPFFLYISYEIPHVPLIHSAHLSNDSRRGLYGDVVKEMDDAIGLVLEKLELLGILEETLLLFSSDNGAWINPNNGFALAGGQTYTFDGGSNAPFRGGKGSTWEGGVRVPAIFWMSDQVYGSSQSIGRGVCQSQMSNLDFLPTIADMVGFSLPSDREYDGVSLLPNLVDPTKCAASNDGSTDPRQWTFYWRTHIVYAVRYRKWKANYITRDGWGEKPPQYHDPPLLFNIEWDYSESLPLNSSDFTDLLQMIDEAKRAHEQSVYADAALSGFDYNDWETVPCCNKGFNVTEAMEYYEEGEVGLAVWDECVCSISP